MEDVSRSSLSEMRRQKKKRRNTQKFLGFVIILTVILGLYVSRERWMPNFKIDNSGYTDDEISGDGFPLKISNSTNYKSCGTSEGFAVLTDTRLYYYSASGEQTDVRQHTYSNTILKNAGKRILIYEQNGNSIRVDGRREEMYEKKMDNSIYLASVSSRGYTAVVTESDQYVCELHVFDQMGDEVYFRGCSERITDVVFKNEGKGCYFISLDVYEGHIISQIDSIDFENTEAGWTAENIETCPVSVFVSETDDVVLFGDSMCTFYSSEGSKVMDYQYPGILTDASYCDSGAAMIFENKERKSTTLAVINNPSSGNVTEVKIQNSFRSVEACENAVYLLAENAIDAYDYEGRIIRTTELTEPFRGFYKSGKYVFLEGHNKIERIEF
ncbi:MAG: DUF5711 family protein [Oscillospiraceae bacterium]